MKRITLGILAHVDAGKTTLTEAMLYNAGAIATLGRVDKKSTVLDTHSIERERGITIFSKLALFDYKDTAFTLLDTPGHLDFFAEAERSLSVMDYAVLVISALDGAVSHTKTLYNLLRAHRVPTFIFVNKTDISERRRIDILSELKVGLDSRICDFNLECERPDDFYEECASHDEGLMDDFFSGRPLDAEKLIHAIRAMKIAPCFFGSALKNTGVSPLMRALDLYTQQRAYSKTLFGAKVFKIQCTDDATRLTYMKIMGGDIKIKDTLEYKIGNEIYSERVEQIRLYSAEKYKLIKNAEAGMIIAIPGLKNTRAGLGIGTAVSDECNVTPVLDYRMVFDPGVDIYDAYLKLIPLAEEEPTLALRYDERLKQIRLRLMGPIQAQVLTKIINERFGLSVSFAEAGILYKETIVDKAYGAGHFEPLMHYAEVRLRLEPLPAGSGLVFASEVNADTLKTNWQRLIISHLEERVHRGKLIGAPITDMKITLIAGRAHPKHTEGGDFRQATFRALNQGLMKAELRLLEPTYHFEITLPRECLSRLIYDIDKMHGECDAPIFDEENVSVSGFSPVYGMRSYINELRAYTRGEGKMTLTAGEYVPCHNAEEIIKEYAYDAEGDVRANPNSVFCKGGAGYLVPWYLADEKMHTENPEERTKSVSADDAVPIIPTKKDYRGTVEEDKELMRIFESTYGKIKPRHISERRENSAPNVKEKRRRTPPVRGEEYLIIDGYNLIHSDKRLSEIAALDLSHARDMLIQMICNYRGYKRCRPIIVFDAYKRRGSEGSHEEYGDVSVIYTKERQTADAYIERATYEIKSPDIVRVVSSDYNEQLIVLGNGGIRVTTKEFLEELALVNTEIRDIIGGE